MHTELEFAGYRYSVFAEQVLQPAALPFSVPLPAGAHQCAEPIPYAQAIEQDYEPVPLGWRWGPAWSTAWFRLAGRVPESLAGWPVALRFSTGTEALLWEHGVPRQGLDGNHETALLFDRAAGGETFELFIEAACYRRLGVSTFWWEHQEVHRRWEEDKPGRLACCELVAFDETAWRLWHTYEFARQLMLLLPEDSLRARNLGEALEQATRRIDDRNVTARAAEIQHLLETTLRGDGPTCQTRCYTVGHAHIDTAWLWTVRDTKRKCLRTFSTAMDLLERYADFRFVSSQAQQYAWLEESSPELFARVAEQVRRGRWEACGAMWVEADCNLPSGESLIRQILHGTRYWRDRFGEHGAQRCLYLPDSFGFPAGLPQIARLAGLDTFVTNKLSWSETNEFPHVNFIWRGLDGSEIIAHCTPGQDYNAVLTPAELLRGERNAARLDASGAGLWLQPFGQGDGGGGPTDWSIEHARLAGRCEPLPHVQLARIDEFCEALHERYAEQRGADGLWPVWDGELYLELHRATYTTCGWIKRANRRAEDALHLAEWLSFAGPKRPDDITAANVQSRLDRAWKLLLLNQFHDVITGVCIAEVFEDTRRQFDEIEQTYQTIIAEALDAWRSGTDTNGQAAPMLVVNPSSFVRSGLVECDGAPHYVADLPPLSVSVRDRAEPAAVPPAVADGRRLSNGLISAIIDEAGRIASLRHEGLNREACAAGEALNQLVLYESRPRAWEAWDLDPEYECKPEPVEGPADSFEIVESGPLQAAIEITRPIGLHSRLTQRYVLEAGSPRLDVQTRIDWHEDRRVLRALFPVDARAAWATYDVQFGHVERPTHRNTSWDRARFEVCAHRWMDLSEAGFGVALLNDCKYGHSCYGHVMGLTLLTSPRFPDPRVDRGEHEFTYSLMPHDGDWRRCGVDREAERLNRPLIARPLPPNRPGPIKDCWSPVTWHVEGAAGVSVAALKRAEADDRLILRLVETHGARGRVTLNWHLPVAAVQPVNLLEEPIDHANCRHDPEGNRTTFTVQPFQIVTLALTLGDAPFQSNE